MGEEHKKAPEEKEIVDEKQESSRKEGEKKEGEGEEKAPPPPEEVVMKVYMHCEACARKVKRCLRRIEGVESVVANNRDHIVVVKGKKAAENPMRVVERVKSKCGRKVELICPIPAPQPEKNEEIKVEESKPVVLEPQVITALLRVYMHCEACSKEIKKRILKMKGVQRVEPDLNSHEVTVKGVFDSEKLAKYIRKRTGKHAVVLKQELSLPPPEQRTGKHAVVLKQELSLPPTEQKAEEEKQQEGEEEEKTVDKPEGEVENSDGKEEKKGEGLDDGEEKEAKEKDKQTGAEEATGGASSAVLAAAIVDSGGKVVGVMRNNDFYCYYPMYQLDHSYPPQIFSDENPNACTVM